VINFVLDYLLNKNKAFVLYRLNSFENGFISAWFLLFSKNSG